MKEIEIEWMGYGIYPHSEKGIQENTYKKPIQHCLAYNNYLAMTCRQRKPRSKSTKDERTFFSTFYGLNKLINMNECDILYNK